MKINVKAPINSLGYGICAKNITYEFVRQGHDVSLFPIGQPELEKESDIPILRRIIDNQGNFDCNAPSFTVWHQFALAERVGNGLNSALTFFELDKLTDRELCHIQSVDKLFVASQWAKNIINNHNLKTPTEVIPMGVDTTIFTPSNKPINNENTIFLHIGKAEIRKGLDVLCDAFSLAFQPTDNVELWLMVQNPFLNQEQTISWIQLFQKSPMGQHVRFFPRVRTTSWWTC